MFIVKYYLFGALALLVAAAFTPSLYFTAILVWASMSLLAVSAAYLLDRPSIFRKKDNGSIPFYIKWLFMPFFIGVQVYNGWARKNDSVPAVQKIAPNLYLACRLFPSDTAFLEKEGVHAILDATAEFDGLNWSAEDSELAYLNIPVLDHETPHQADIQKAVNWITHHTKNNRGVVVHCAMGRGRSVLIVAAYLLASRAFKNVDDALAYINQSRSTAQLNKRQHAKLSEMHKSGILFRKEAILLIVNPVSGGGSWSEHQEMIEQLLSPSFEIDIKMTTADLSAKTIAKQNKDKGYKIIVACGGDGTVNEVADALVDSDICMGIIPLGTTNALSHVLYGVQVKFRPIKTACNVILQGYLRKIDTAICNQETMVLIAGLGFEQRMITLANRENKNESGEMAYIQALGSAINQNEKQRYKIRVNCGEQKLIEATSLVVANAAPFTTILAQGGDSPSPLDGQLDMTVLNTDAQTMLPIAALGLRGLTRRWMASNEIEGIRHEKVNEILIEDENDSELDYVIDGEVRKSNSIHIKIKPSSLWVMHLG